jgi:hypothetical protein
MEYYDGEKQSDPKAKVINNPWRITKASYGSRGYRPNTPVIKNSGKLSKKVKVSTD